MNELLDEADDPAGARHDTSVDRQHAPTSEGQRTGDLSRLALAEGRDDAVVVDNSSSTRHVEQSGGQLLTSRSEKSVANRHPNPALASRLKVVTGQDSAHRVIDPFRSISPPEVFVGSKCSKQFCAGQDDRVPAGQPVDFFGRMTPLVVGLAAVQCQTRGKLRLETRPDTIWSPEPVHAQREDLEGAEHGVDPTAKCGGFVLQPTNQVDDRKCQRAAAFVAKLGKRWPADGLDFYAVVRFAGLGPQGP